MSTFTINPNGDIVTATVDFNNSSHAIAYGIVVFNGDNYEYQVSGDNKVVTNDDFHLPSPAINLVGRQLYFQVKVNRMTLVTNWKVTLTVSQGNGNSQVYSVGNNSFTMGKDSRSTTVDFA